MPGIDFRKRFSQAVKDGLKTQTIRKRRTPPIEEGQHLTLWTGQRTKNSLPLGDATCTKVEPIKIIPERGEIWVWDEESEWQDKDGVYGNFKLLAQSDAEKFAIADGFKSMGEFFEFFKHYPSDVLHFELVIIHWRLGWNFKRGAATLSGLYNCNVCGEEKCLTPGICEDCLTPPTAEII